MQKSFTTNRPTSLYVEIGAGQVEVRATETSETEVLVEGRGADDVTVEQRGDQIVVLGPKGGGGLGFFGFGSDLSVSVTMPLDSDLTTKLGSADLTATGRLRGARIKSGSGEVTVHELTEDAVIQTGSGDVEVGSSLGDLRVKTGSGHVHVGRVAGSTVVSSGSGRITVEDSDDAIDTKTGSGEIRIVDGSNHVSMTSGSGDLEVGRMRKGVMKAKTASGDVRIGVPAGIPVWTDISCLTGDVRSNLEGAGQPEEGQDYVEIRATTVSGDITLSQL